MIYRIDSFIHLLTELPVFTKELSDASNIEGETVSLEVVIKSDSNCQLKWFKDGNAITEGGRISLVNCGEGRYSLVIQDAEDGDSGQYCCVAQNESGKVTSTGKLSVEGKRSFSSKMGHTTFRYSRRSPSDQQYSHMDKALGVC